MAHFEVGGKVICVKSHNQGIIKNGDVFELLGIRKCKCGCIQLNIGIYGLECTKCLEHGEIEEDKQNIWWFSSSRFLPYDDGLSELTAEDILNEETVII